MVKIAPSVLAANFSRLGEEITAAEKAGADMIHLDIMDGHFVPNLSFGAAISAMSKSICALPHDAHLMMTDPDTHIDAFIRIKVEYISFHIEIGGQRVDSGNGRWVYHTSKVIDENRIRSLATRIRMAGCKAGLAVNPPTEMVEALPLLKEFDLLLLMSVNPGFAGQAFMPEVIGKIRSAAEYRKVNGLKFEIMVDGGVGLDNSKELVKAGADILVAGNSFFRSSDYAEFVRKVKA